MYNEPAVQRVPVSALTPSPYNPRRISDEALSGLRSSIKRFGLVVPILVNKNYQVIGGHQRLRIVKESGVKETTVVVVDLPEHEEKALNITLNNSAVMGEFIEEDLSELLETLGNTDTELYASLRLDAFSDADLHDLTESADQEAQPALTKQCNNDAPPSFSLIVEVDSPEEQEDLYNRLHAEGYNVRVRAR